MIYGIEIENIWDVGVVMEFVVLVSGVGYSSKHLGILGFCSD